MVGISNELVELLERKSTIDQRAEQIGLKLLDKWVEEQLRLCVTRGGVVTRELVQQTEPMSDEFFAALSTALDMDIEAISSQATTILRRKSFRGAEIPGLLRFEAYRMSQHPTIKLQYKH